MPFDGNPVADAPKRLYALGSDLLHFGTTPTPPAYTAPSRPIPAWHSSRRAEVVCRAGSFARTATGSRGGTDHAKHR